LILREPFEGDPLGLIQGLQISLGLCHLPLFDIRHPLEQVDFLRGPQPRQGFGIFFF
jgi:hypothetical protein